MDAKSLTINKMFYFSLIINMKECDELTVDDDDDEIAYFTVR